MCSLVNGWFSHSGRLECLITLQGAAEGLWAPLYVRKLLPRVVQTTEWFGSVLSLVRIPLANSTRLLGRDARNGLLFQVNLINIIVRRKPNFTAIVSETESLFQLCWSILIQSYFVASRKCQQYCSTLVPRLPRGRLHMWVKLDCV